MFVKLFTVVKFKLLTPELINPILVHQFSFETVPILVYMGTHRRSGFGSRCSTTDVHAIGGPTSCAESDGDDTDHSGETTVR